MIHSPIRPVTAFVIMTACTAIYAQTQFKQLPPEQQAFINKQLTEQAVTTSAMRSFRDPVTGEQRAPNAQELAEIVKAEKARSGELANAKQAAALQVKRHANGMTSASMPLDMMNYSSVKVNADGSTSHYCTDGSHHAHSSALSAEVTK